MLIGCNPKSLQQMLIWIHMQRFGALDGLRSDAVRNPQGVCLVMLGQVRIESLPGGLCHRAFVTHAQPLCAAMPAEEETPAPGKAGLGSDLANWLLNLGMTPMDGLEKGLASLFRHVASAIAYSAQRLSSAICVT